MRDAFLGSRNVILAFSLCHQVAVRLHCLPLAASRACLPGPHLKGRRTLCKVKDKSRKVLNTKVGLDFQNIFPKYRNIFNIEINK